MARLTFKAGTLSVVAAALLVACGDSGTTTTTGSGGAGTTTSATTGTGGSGGAGGALPVKEVMCEGSLLLEVPEDPAAEGPWPVGARTVTVAGLVTEIWYPAVVGSEAGKDKVLYDLRKHLPAADQGKIPDADNPYQACNCYRDLPLDEAHGPYPQVLFIHGTAAFRSQSATQMTHWASRGFVVVSSDHPGIGLADILSGKFGTSDQPGDAGKVLDALDAPAGELAFLAGRLAKGEIALSGHSAGGGAVSGFGGRAKVLIPMAAGGVDAGATLVSSLVLGAFDDGIVKYTSQQSGYDKSPVKKRLVGISGAGHLAFSDLCAIGTDKGGILQVAIDHGVNVNPLIATLATDGCKPGQLAPEKGWAIINAASSAVLEESLSCSTTAAAKIGAIKATYADVGDYQEAL